MTTISPLRVDRLVGGDRIEPRTELPTLFKRVALLVDLEERRLEHVFCQRGVTQEPTKVIIQFTLVARDQLGKDGRIASLAVRLQQLFVADGRRIELTHPCLVGRQPPDDHTLGGEPAMAVHVDDELHHVSQRHLEIQIVGWDVRAVDCGSTNGSRFRRAGSRRAGPLKPHVPQPLEPGDQIEVGARTITYVEQAP